MGVDTPAAGVKQNPVMKHEGRPTYHGRHNIANRSDNNNMYNTREKLLGADSNLHGKVFEAKRN